MIEILSLAGKLSVDWTAFCLHANVRFLGAMVTTLNTLRATIDVYQTARKGFKYGEKIMHEVSMLQNVLYAIIQSKANMPDHFSLPTVTDLIENEIPRYNQEIDGLKKTYPSGRTARIRASFTWMSQNGHAKTILQSLRHFHAMLDTALAADHMYV